MNISQIYLIISIVVLAVIALLVFVLGKKEKGKKLTPLASFAFAFVLADPLCRQQVDRLWPDGSWSDPCCDRYL